MKFSKLFNGFHLFRRAYDVTHHQIWDSIKILILITLFFAILMWIAEGSKNPDFSFIDALVWTFV
jgi:hypothetical protein